MEIRFDELGRLSILSVLTPLIGGEPVLNGSPLTGARSKAVESGPDRWLVRYTAEDLGAGVFGLEIWREGDGLALVYWLEGLPAETPLDAFGLRFAAVENLRQYLCSGYFSWDGSFYVQPEGLDDFSPDEPRPETGYALTQLLPRDGEGSVVLGFDRHDRFQHTFHFDTHAAPPALTIQTLWDCKERGNRCESERLVIFEHPEVENGLRRWAGIVASASPTPPRLPAEPITGWCSWYNLYAQITEENLRHHLHAAAQAKQRDGLPLRVFQIDDGFTPEMGDWLEVKPQFPRGIKPLLDEIREAGFIPGLWIGPYMVGNRSRLYREHPDWVVQDRQTGGPLVQMSFYGEFRWHKRSEEYYILDATHPDAFEYLRTVFHTWRHEWGCEYFKTDFMHFGAAHGPERAVHHTPGMTRIEIWRRVAEMIRAEIGDALWLGCGFPLWAAVGLADGVRIGRDVGVEWKGDLSAQSLLRDQSTRNFANHILWQADPDCVLLRPRFHHLTDTEIRALAIYAGMPGGVIMTSDDLSELPPERLELFSLILSMAGTACDFPLLGAADLAYQRLADASAPGGVRHKPVSLDPVLVQVRRQAGGKGLVCVFNTADQPSQRMCDFARLGLPGAKRVTMYGGVENLLNGGQVSVTLAAHEGVLLAFT